MKKELKVVEEVTEVTEVGNQIQSFTKEQLISADRYADRRDLVSALLVDDESYSFDEVDQMIQAYMKGGIK